MGTSCSACLPQKVKDYAAASENGAVTVIPFDERTHDAVGPAGIRCSVCHGKAEFNLSYFPKKPKPEEMMRIHSPP